MKKCINLANSTFNLYVLYIKLAQNTKQLADDIEEPILISDIDRSHPIGRPGVRQGSGRPRHRDILVKFATYNVRRRVFIKRKTLHDRDDMKHIFLNEDLTKSRSKLLYDVRC